MTDIIAKYKNGDTVVTLYTDGTKQRDISNGSFAEYPETLDVKITNWCDAKCHFCHENSTTRGKHGDLQPTIDLLKQLPKGSEIACLSGDTLVLTKNGYVCMDELSVGDSIMTSNGKSSKIVNISTKEKDCIKLVGSNGFSAISSKDHPFIVDGNLVNAEDLLGKCVDTFTSIKIDSHIQPPIDMGKYIHVKTDCVGSISGVKTETHVKLTSRSDPALRFVELTPELMYFYGVVVAEGSSKGVSLHKNEIDIAKTLSQTYKRITGGLGSSVYKNGNNGINVEFSNSKYFSHLFFDEMNVGKGAHNKTLGFLYTIDDINLIRAALRGLVDGDGCYRKRKKTKNGFTSYSFSISLKTVSKLLAYDFLTILRNKFGINASIYHGNSKKRKLDDRILEESEYYMVDVYGKENINLLFPDFFSDDDYFKNSNKGVIKRNNKQIKIKDIIPVGIKKVYDITLEDDSTHVFVINGGVLTHNCGGGHPLSHPEFDNFVKELSSHGIICNVTINEFHFKNELNRIENLVSDGLIYGVGYSYSSIPCEWDYEHLVSHVIIGVTSYFDLDNIIAGNNKKVLLLGFKKKTGRGDIFYRKNNELVDKKINQWYAGLFNAVSKAHISFDNNAIAQLKPSRLFNNRDDYDSFFMGDDGSYSMYIDAVKQEFSVSSTGVDRHQYKDSLAYMFQMVQNKSY